MSSDKTNVNSKIVDQLISMELIPTSSHTIDSTTPSTPNIEFLRSLKPGHYIDLPKWVSHGFILYGKKGTMHLDKTNLNYSNFRNFHNMYTSSPLRPCNSIDNLTRLTIQEEYTRIEELRELEIRRSINVDNSIWFTRFEGPTRVTLNSDNSLYLAVDTTRMTADRAYNFLEKIECLIFKMLKRIADNKPLIFEIDKHDLKNLTIQDDILTKKKRRQKRLIRFYSKQSSHHFAVMMFLLSEIYKLLVSGSNATKREIYYLQTTFLKNQTALTRALYDLCEILDASPWELAIFSSAKGIMAGDIVMIRNDGDHYDFRQFSNGLVLPNDVMNVKSIDTDAKFILIIEKESIFHRLLNDNIFKKLQEKFIMVTGKGYPDINSRWILKKIWNDFKLPMFILVDSDPHGIEIMCTYKYGSMAMATHSDSLAIPTIKWIGIQPTDIEVLCLSAIPLTVEDYKRIDSILDRDYISYAIKRELICLKNLNCKSELECLYNLSANFMIEVYIKNKVIFELNVVPPNVG